MFKDTILIILNYKRPRNVVKLIFKFKHIIPILIINNNPDFKINPIDGVAVINNKENFWCLERWKIAKDLNFKYAILLDDDIEPSMECITLLRSQIEKTPDRLVSIYGRSGINSKNCYEDLDSFWCIDSEVELAVGACIAVSISHLKAIWDKYNIPSFFVDRGDDILVSLAMTDFYKKKHKTVKTFVTSLEEGDVGLNKNPDHFKKRWEVISKFRSPFTAFQN